MARENVSIWAVTAALVSSFTVIACRGFFSMLALAPDDCAGLLCDSTLGQQRKLVVLVFAGRHPRDRLCRKRATRTKRPAML